MILLPAFISIIQNAVICTALLCLLALFTWILVKLEQKRPAPIPPATDEDADDLPFGPATHEQD